MPSVLLPFEYTIICDVNWRNCPQLRLIKAFFKDKQTFVVLALNESILLFRDQSHDARWLHKGTGANPIN